MTDQMRYTKTFTEVQYYRREAVVHDSVTWQRLKSEHLPLDQQIRNWVDQTGALIQHPGQLGIHIQWLDDSQTMRSVTLGLTVLYTEGAIHGEGNRSGQEDAARAGGGIGPGPDSAAPGGPRSRTVRVPATARVPISPELARQLAAPAATAPHVASVYQPGALPEPAAFTPIIASGEYPQYTGENCADCGQPQFHSPGGVTCSNGHGGADGVPPGTPPVRRPTIDPFG